MTQGAQSATAYNDKAKVRDHYDRASPYYHSLWGEHLHHGYWIRGDETKEIAQLQLVEHLAAAAGIRRGSKILDAGCGFGASSIYLAGKYDADATGITISPVQVEMANAAAAKQNSRAKFHLMDAEELNFAEPFDVIWSVESISHYPHREKFFAGAARLLKPGGTLALIDWFKKEHLTAREYEKFIEPIEKGMLVDLQTMDDYARSLESNHLQIAGREVMNKNCAKTWDLCLDIISDKAIWALALQNGREFINFLRAFGALRAGFSSGSFIYGMIVAKKP